MKRKQFEYKHEYIAIMAPSREDDPHEHYRSAMLEEVLNRHGAKGWELVSISPELLNGENVDGYAVFKRRLKIDN